ncbi:hypothetical protein K431DRAFT_234337 [Polychaeton citri CBS 116435]|uniref:Glycerate dehydrogenase n=1 Tax=Polychaeton citri CBS 116435 TaxID=1314669 RepID=A0A9P4PZW9_9PEZI|nr:hypothetical protein K431DRAFT_234337 [Polychaeton citri CBS 116435]
MACKHKLVAIDSCIVPPQVDFECETIIYDATSPEELPDRIKDATMITTGLAKVTRTDIEAASRLQLISACGTGSDHIDKKAAHEKGITVCHIPAQNTESVSEHALALYYSLRRRIGEMHDLTLSGTIWPPNPAVLAKLGNPPPRTNSQETLVIVGYGKMVEKLGKTLGMLVLISERKGSGTIRDGRTPFDEAVHQGTLFILTAPLNDSTRGMFGAAEFSIMDNTALFVNISRGALVDEHALAAALRGGQIGGAATDVYEHEPATTENCPLIDPSIPNLILSPHIAWYSLKTIEGSEAILKANLEAFAAGSPINVVLPSISE